MKTKEIKFAISKEWYAELAAERLDGKLSAEKFKEYEHPPEDLTRHGFIVVGPNLVDGELNLWFPRDFDFAKSLAKAIATKSGKETFVLKYVGSYNIGK